MWGTLFRMIESGDDDKLQQAAAVRIIARRDALLADQKILRAEQIALIKQDQDIERQLAECRAAAKFFKVELEPFENDQEVSDLRARLHQNKLRLTEALVRSSPDAVMWERRVADYELQLRSLIAQKMDAVVGQGGFPKVVMEPAQPMALPQPEKSEAKQPKIRDIAIEQLRSAAPNGLRAAQIRQHIENAYSMEIHEKTVGMTLYRLKNDGLAHRDGQTWFFGPQVGQTLPASTENPGASTPGDTHEAG